MIELQRAIFYSASCPQPLFPNESTYSQGMKAGKGNCPFYKNRPSFEVLVEKIRMGRRKKHSPVGMKRQ